MKTFHQYLLQENSPKIHRFPLEFWPGGCGYFGFIFPDSHVEAIIGGPGMQHDIILDHHPSLFDNPLVHGLVRFDWAAGSRPAEFGDEPPAYDLALAVAEIPKAQHHAIDFLRKHWGHFKLVNIDVYDRNAEHLRGATVHTLGDAIKLIRGDVNTPVSESIQFDVLYHGTHAKPEQILKHGLKPSVSLGNHPSIKDVSAVFLTANVEEAAPYGPLVVLVDRTKLRHFGIKLKSDPDDRVELRRNRRIFYTESPIPPGAIIAIRPTKELVGNDFDDESRLSVQRFYGWLDDSSPYR